MKHTSKTIYGVKVYSDPEAPPDTLYLFNDLKNEPPRRNGTLMDVSEPNMDTEASITLLYPNNTSVTITGDGDIVEQLVDRLNGQVIDYTVRVPYEMY